MVSKRTHSLVSYIDPFVGDYDTLEDLLSTIEEHVYQYPSKRPKEYHPIMLMGLIMSLGWVEKTERGFQVISIKNG